MAQPGERAGHTVDIIGDENDDPSNDLGRTARTELEEGLQRILHLLTRLEKAVEEISSLAWEAEWDRNDLLEDMQSLRQLLHERIPRRGQATTPPPPSEREADREARVRGLEVALRVERSRNWELRELCADHEETIGKYEMQLRNSVPVGDVRRLSRKPRTALEAELENEIMRLRIRIEYPARRGRSRSV